MPSTHLFGTVHPALKAHLHVRRTRLVLPALSPVPIPKDLLDADLAQLDDLLGAGVPLLRVLLGVDPRLEVRGVLGFVRQDEGVGCTLRTGTSGTSDSVDILGDAALCTETKSASTRRQGSQ